MKDRKTGKELIRDKETCTKTGIVLTSKDYKKWQIRYPTPEGDDKRYGGSTTTKRLAIFFLLLDMGHTLEDADDIAFHKTRLRGKYID